MAQRLKHLPPTWETQVWSLGREDPLEKEMATHSSILAWRIPWTEEPGRLPVIEIFMNKISIQSATQTHGFECNHYNGKNISLVWSWFHFVSKLSILLSGIVSKRNIHNHLKKMENSPPFVVYLCEPRFSSYTSTNTADWIQKQRWEQSFIIITQDMKEICKM